MHWLIIHNCLYFIAIPASLAISGQKLIKHFLMQLTLFHTKGNYKRFISCTYNKNHVFLVLITVKSMADFDIFTGWMHLKHRETHTDLYPVHAGLHLQLLHGFPGLRDAGGAVISHSVLHDWVLHTKHTQKSSWESVSSGNQHAPASVLLQHIWPDTNTKHSLCILMSTLACVCIHTLLKMLWSLRFIYARNEYIYSARMH